MSRTHVIMDTAFAGWTRCESDAASRLLCRFKHGSRISKDLILQQKKSALQYASKHILGDKSALQ